MLSVNFNTKIYAQRKAGNYRSDLTLSPAPKESRKELPRDYSRCFPMRTANKVRGGFFNF